MEIVSLVFSRLFLFRHFHLLVLFAHSRLFLWWGCRVAHTAPGINRVHPAKDQVTKVSRQLHPKNNFSEIPNKFMKNLNCHIP